MDNNGLSLVSRFEFILEADYTIVSIFLVGVCACMCVFSCGRSWSIAVNSMETSDDMLRLEAIRTMTNGWQGAPEIGRASLTESP